MVKVPTAIRITWGDQAGCSATGSIASAAPWSAVERMPLLSRDVPSTKKLRQQDREHQAFAQLIEAHRRVSAIARLASTMAAVTDAGAGRAAVAP